ncbi:MAG: DUF2752 domain-containing protein [Ruminococcaceae bacterium]|nr:DUF2752 domain-containing protein [Oscillospiraceae bacterium]
MEKVKKRKVYVAVTAVILLLCIALLIILNLCGAGVPCIFRKLTGWQCAGCGNTRAAISLLKLDFKAMIEYNLLFPLELIYVAWVCFSFSRNYIKTGKATYTTPHISMDIIVLAVMSIWWVVRNL